MKSHEKKGEGGRKWWIKDLEHECSKFNHPISILRGEDHVLEKFLRDRKCEQDPLWMGTSVFVRVEEVCQGPRLLMGKRPKAPFIRWEMFA